MFLSPNLSEEELKTVCAQSPIGYSAWFHAAAIEQWDLSQPQPWWVDSTWCYAHEIKSVESIASFPMKDSLIDIADSSSTIYYEQLTMMQGERWISEGF